MEVSSTTLAEYLDAEHHGPETVVDGIDSPESATEIDLTYVTIYDDVPRIEDSNAGVILAPPELVTEVTDATKTLIEVEDTRVGYSKLAQEFISEEASENIHPTAHISPEATIGEGCTIGPFAVIEAPVEIGDNCSIGAGSVLGADGFYFVRDESASFHKHYQTGTVKIEDNVSLGAHCVVDRAMFETTVIEQGSKLDSFIHVGHDVSIGEDCYIPSGCMFGGFVTVEGKVRLNPQATITNRTMISEGAEVGINSIVADDVEPYTKVASVPARKIGESRMTEYRE